MHEEHTEQEETTMEASGGDVVPATSSAHDEAVVATVSIEKNESDSNLPASSEASNASSETNSAAASSSSVSPAPQTPSKTDAVQIVDENGEFCSQMSATFEHWGMTDVGNDYNVVAILGAQSSGKSTLLNLLFGTTFEVLDGTRRRGQTTKGIWCSRAENLPLLILDVEGTDGRERGDDTNFERKSSLFSLALAPVLLVNMFFHDLGRWNGANMGLLRTVFELNLQLFLANRQELPTKHLLLFVIRDHEETPAEEVRQIILADMTKLWQGVTKPQQFESSLITHFFDFEIMCLPPKMLKTEFFPAVQKFRDWFYERQHERYVWHDGKYPVDVPSDGFLHYSDSVWEVIKSNKDLDIPSQKQLLARFRCDEISVQMLNAFNADLAALATDVDALSLEPAAAQGIASFGQRVSAALTSAVQQYNAASVRYDRGVAAEIRVALFAQMKTAARSLFRSYLLRVVDATKKLFEATLTTQLDEQWQALVADWQGVTGQLEQRTLDSFHAVVAAARPDVDVAQLGVQEADAADEWSAVAELASLRDTVAARLVGARQSVAQRIEEGARRDFETQLDRPVSAALDSVWKTPGQLWSQIRAVFGRHTDEAARSLEARLRASLGYSEAESAATVERLQQQFVGVLVALMKTKSSFAKMRMQKRFSAVFDRDEQDLPRRWKPEDPVAAIYKRALEEATEILEALSILRLSPDDDSLAFLSRSNDVDVDPARVLLSRDECERLRQEFQADCDARYYNALRDQESAASASSVPLPLIVLLCILGFNEVVYVITSPLLLTLTVLGGAAVFVIWKLNLYPVIRPVLKTVVQTTAGSVKPFVQAFIRNVQEARAPGEHIKKD